MLLDIQEGSQLSKNETEIFKSIFNFLDISLPKSYKKFLLENKNFDFSEKEKNIFIVNKTKFSGVLRFFYEFSSNINDDILYHLKLYRYRIPKNMISIACDNYGNQILLSVKGPDYGKVYFWDHEQEADTENGEEPSYNNLTLIANSFDEFMNGLYGEEELEEE